MSTKKVFENIARENDVKGYNFFNFRQRLKFVRDVGKIDKDKVQILHNKYLDRKCRINEFYDPEATDKYCILDTEDRKKTTCT